MPFMTYITRHSTTTHQQKQQQQQQQQQQHNEKKYNKRPTSLSAIRKRREIGDYILGKTIGRGASGRVKIGIHRHTGEQVAIKVISRSQLATSSTMARCVQRELAILQLLHHPHLVDLHQVLQDASNVYFVMEYMEGGELFQILSQRGKLPEDEARHLFRQLTTALNWCHAHHICHRDLKPENILLDKEQKHVKLADFGMATIQSPDHFLQTSCGSPHYASPEIVKGKHYYGPTTDVWSCGVILYAMLTGHLPFDDDNVSRLLSKIKTGRYIPLPSHISREAKDLIKNMLMVDPSKRITLDAVLAHPWLTNKSFLGSDLRFPDSLPLYSKPHDNLLHDQQDIDLKQPIISDSMDLDGRIWETLKVLWRDCSQENLLSALRMNGSNVPKLTCRLLQQRAWRQENGQNINNMTATNRNNNSNVMHSSTTTTSPLSEDNGSSIAPMTPPLTPQCNRQYRPYEDCCNNSMRDSTIDTMNRTMTDLPSTPKSIPTFDLNLSWHSEIHPVEVFKKRFFNEHQQEKKPSHRHTLSLDRRPVMCSNCNNQRQSSMSSTITTTTTSSSTSSSSTEEDMLANKPVDPVLVRFAHVQTTIVGASNAQDQLKKLHQKQQQKAILFPSHLTSLYPSSSFFSSSTLKKQQEEKSIFVSDWFQSTWNWCQELFVNHHSTHRYKQNKVFAFERLAKHECEAAGKLHQLLEEHFHGKLSGRIYPTGQIVWSGSLIFEQQPKRNNINNSNNNNNIQEKEQPIQFLCHINPTYSTKTMDDRVKINFVLIEGDSQVMESAIRQLLQIWNTYERDAKTVAAANGWL